jgi:hypothetical protein
MFYTQTKQQVELQFYIKYRREGDEEVVSSYWMI